ncbi:MAG TPA: acetate uptake transporter [Rhodanobacteraceae bacterium]|nr:acetate uptake transporter [Rhodanobacteraceae bacterium]
MNKTANASTLGYAAFALTLWMVSMIHAGWFDASEGSINLMLAVTLGGTAMAIAGILEYFRGRTADMLLFLGFGAFWWAWALNRQAIAGGGATPTAGYEAWYFIVWAVLAFGIWFADFREGTAKTLFTLGLWLTLLSLALAGWTGLGWFTTLGGYLGLITAVIAMYTAWADVINESRGRGVLPTGEHAAGEPILHG